MDNLKSWKGRRKTPGTTNGRRRAWKANCKPDELQRPGLIFRVRCRFPARQANNLRPQGHRNFLEGEKHASRITVRIFSATPVPPDYCAKRPSSPPLPGRTESLFV